MQQRILPIAIFLAFLFCYLEWAGGNSGFIFQLEYDAFSRGMDKSSFMHPLIILPLVGQIMLFISIILLKRKAILVGILLLSVLVVVIFLVGLLAFNLKIILSALPFLVLSALYISRYRKEKRVRLDM
jgi:hypothetical protein